MGEAEVKGVVVVKGKEWKERRKGRRGDRVKRRGVEGGEDEMVKGKDGVVESWG